MKAVEERKQLEKDETSGADATSKDGNEDVAVEKDDADEVFKESGGPSATEQFSLEGAQASIAVVEEAHHISADEALSFEADASQSVWDDGQAAEDKCGGDDDDSKATGNKTPEAEASPQRQELFSPVADSRESSIMTGPSHCSQWFIHVNPHRIYENVLCDKFTSSVLSSFDHFQKALSSVQQARKNALPNVI